MDDDDGGADKIALRLCGVSMQYKYMSVRTQRSSLS